MMSYSEQTTLGTGITLDAWGRQKTITDFSILHGVFTLDIPKEKWLVIENGVESFTSTSALAYNRSGALYMDCKEGEVEVRSKRHPRYQPNRGHLYSSSIFLPSPEREGIREFGIATTDSGVFFRLTKDGLFAVVRTTEENSFFLTEGGDTLIQENGFNLVSQDGGVIEDIRLIDTTGIDLSKGNIYDIQVQWRGVGNYKFYINQKLVKTFDYLGTLENLSSFNPALPVFYKAINDGQDVIIKSGCVDVTSEGGVREEVQYSSVTAPETATTTAEQTLLVFHIPKTKLGLINTRDCIISRLTAYSTADATVRVYYARNSVTANFRNVGAGFQQFAITGDNIVFDKTKAQLLASYRTGANQTAVFDNPLRNSNFYFTNGDYFIITLQGKNNSQSGCNLEYGQEI